MREPEALRANLRRCRRRLGHPATMTVEAFEGVVIRAALTYVGRCPEVYIPVTYLLPQDTPRLQADVRDHCRFAVRHMAQTAALFPPGSVVRLMQMVRSAVLAARQDDQIKQTLKQNVLLLTLDVAGILAAWVLDLVSEGYMTQARERLGRMRTTCNQDVSTYRTFVEGLQVGMSVCLQMDQLIAHTVWQAEEMADLASLTAVRQRDKRHLKEAKQWITRVPLRLTAARLLVRRLVEAAAETLSSASGGPVPSEFATQPLFGQGGMAAIDHAALHRGLDLSLLDAGAESRLYQLTKEARRVSQRLRQPVPPQAQNPVPEIPVLFGGATPAAFSPARRLHVLATVAKSLERGFPALHAKKRVLAHWQLPVVQPPSLSVAKNDRAQALPTLVFCVDTSGSTQAMIAKTPFTVLQACQMAGVSAQLFLSSLAERGMDVPDFVSVNFSDDTIVRSGSSHAAGLNIAHVQQGGTSLDVAKVLNTIEGPLQLVVVTDGGLQAAEGTAKALAHERVKGVVVFEVMSQEGSSLSPFSTHVVQTHPKAQAFPVTLADESTLITAFHHLIKEIYDLDDKYLQGPTKANAHVGQLVVR